ncbi:ABC transporter permease [Zafaria sp. J156]|uniref:ABC transporter permease n=1 Tax=Zafaria sp. J156 TaxID=3116490 RepID=UPI002E7689F1|nr:ABC transporter permease [Zafaria sp. J156]MEE1621879.1 ABC transporter permease [Zafaria sp. J156]
MQHRFLVLKRVGQSLLVIALTYVFVFYVLFLLPGDPVKSRIENPQNPIPAEQAAAILAYYNLDRGGLEQFWISVTRLFQGDLGYSLGTGRPVAELIRDGFAETITLAGLALVLALALSLVIAATAVLAPWRWARGLAEKLPVIALATPGFLVGLVLLQVFAYQLGWFSSIRDEGFKSLVLPAVTLAIGVSAPIAQVLIHGLRHAYAEPFVAVLRAKGVPESRIFGEHVLKNASIPALTLFGLTVGELLAGSVIAEAVFNRSGLGFITEQAVRAQDGPVVQAIVMLVAVIFTLVNLLTDLLYPVIDRRITPRGGGPAAERPASTDQPRGVTA